MNEVRARIRQRRESGRFDAGVQAALDRPLPGGAPIFTDELADPLNALPDLLDADLAYDPRSRRRYVGPVITLARRAAIEEGAARSADRATKGSRRSARGRRYRNRREPCRRESAGRCGRRGRVLCCWRGRVGGGTPPLHRHARVRVTVGAGGRNMAEASYPLRVPASR